MRKWKNLTKAEQKKAVGKALNQLLRAIAEEGLQFDDKKNKNTLQAAIDGAVAEAESMRTPWFAGEYIMDATFTDELRPGEELSVADELKSMAIADAEDAVYPGPGERVIEL